MDDAVTAQIAEAGPDVAAIVAYGGLIPRAALDVPPHGWINLHFSLLPAWRGAAPCSAPSSPATTSPAPHLPAGRRLDTGPVFGTLTEGVRPDDTAGELLERLSHSGAVLLAQTLSAVEAGRRLPRPQAGEVIAGPQADHRRRPARLEQPALAIGRRARGVTPEPGAWTTLDGQRVKLEPVAAPARSCRTWHPVQLPSEGKASWWEPAPTPWN